MTISGQIGLGKMKVGQVGQVGQHKTMAILSFVNTRQIRNLPRNGGSNIRKKERKKEREKERKKEREKERKKERKKGRKKKRG